MTWPMVATNARYMPIRAIARSFVPHPGFSRLVSANHVLMFGSRGTGKTTLLFMLTHEAAEIYQQVHPDSDEVPLPNRLAIPVRAPAGVLSHYSQLIESRYHQFGPSEAADYASISTLLYRDHVLRIALREIRSVLLRSGTQLRDVGKNRALAEASICGAIGPVWGVDAATFDGIDRGIVSRSRAGLSVLGRSVVPDSVLAADEGFPLLQCLGELSQSLRDSNLADGVSLLADELELLPYGVRHYLLSSLRDADDLVLLKLALNPGDLPVGELRRLVGPSTEVHDFARVSLSNPSRDDALDFGMRLMENLAPDFSQERPFVACLGPSLWDTTQGILRHAWRGSEPYGKSTERRLVALEGKDSGFRRYLKENGLSIQELTESTRADRASDLRKMRGVVIVRDLFPSQRGRRPGPQGVRSLGFVTGAEAVLLCLEGNPRWIVAFMNEVGERWNGHGEQVSRAVQSAALRKVLEVARARCMVVHRIRDSPADSLDRTASDDEAKLPIVEASTASMGARALDLLDRVSQGLQVGVLGPIFISEPALQFHVDDGVDVEDLRLLQQLIANGLVVADTRDLSWDGDPTGFDFRLSYLQAANYGLPPLRTRAVMLSNLVRPGSRRRARGQRQVSPRSHSATEAASLLDGLRKVSVWSPQEQAPPRRRGAGFDRD